MKKFLNCLILFLVVISFSGCDAGEKESGIMFDSLKTEKIVDKDFEFIEKITSKNISYTISSETYYVYKDTDDNLIAVKYSYANEDYGSEADYIVSIYKASLINEKINYIDKEQLGNIEHYYIYDDKYSENNKYDFKLTDKYAALERKSMFAKKYYTFTPFEG